MTQSGYYNQPEMVALVAQLQDLVKMALDCKDRDLKDGVSLVDVSKQIAQLRALVDEMQSMYESAIGDMALSEQDVQKMKRDAEALPPEEKKILNVIESMKAQCEIARDEMYHSLMENKSTLKQVEEGMQDEEVKKIKRKGKFKGVGGKKGWIPS